MGTFVRIKFESIAKRGEHHATTLFIISLDFFLPDLRNGCGTTNSHGILVTQICTYGHKRR
ncbi:MAG: hypothetical protein HW390_3375 [Candidatus Brocadiaceae bacterium]|nr:hypothetical protein [Candidatus Brocadiaceae bacterium]